MKRAAKACFLSLGRLLLAAALMLGVRVPIVYAQATLTWGATGGGGSGTWDTSTSNWFNGSAVTWTQGSSATFGGTAGTVTVGAPITVQNMTFSTNGYNRRGSQGLPALRANNYAVAIPRHVCGLDLGFKRTE